MAAPAKKGGDLRVTAPLVQLNVGGKIVHLFSGDVVPAGVSKESIEHLSELGYVTESE